MLLREIQVQCHAGYKGEETPRRFCFDDLWVEIVEVLDRWHQVESLPEWPRANYFKVAGEDGHRYLLKHDLESGQWYFGRKW